MRKRRTFLSGGKRTGMSALRCALLLTLLWLTGTMEGSPLFPVAPSAAPTPEIMWVKFTEGSGTTAAATVGPNLTLSSPTWVTGKSGTGYALQFNGTSDGASTALAPTYGVNIITVCFWYYVTAYTGNNMVIAESLSGGYTTDGGWAILVDLTTGEAETLTYRTGYSLERFTHTSITTWHHWAAVLNASVTPHIHTTYIDGVLQTTSPAISSAVTGNFLGFTMGFGNHGGGEWFKGRLDDFRIYNHALTPAEITAVKNDPQ